MYAEFVVRSHFYRILSGYPLDTYGYHAFRYGYKYNEETGKSEKEESDEAELIYNSHSWNSILINNNTPTNGGTDKDKAGNDLIDFSEYLLPKRQDQLDLLHQIKLDPKPQLGDAIDSDMEQEKIQRYILERMPSSTAESGAMLR